MSVPVREPLRTSFPVINFAAVAGTAAIRAITTAARKVLRINYLPTTLGTHEVCWSCACRLVRLQRVKPGPSRQRGEQLIAYVFLGQPQCLCELIRQRSFLFKCHIGHSSNHPISFNAWHSGHRRRTAVM